MITDKRVIDNNTEYKVKWLEGGREEFKKLDRLHCAEAILAYECCCSDAKMKDYIISPDNKAYVQW